MAQYIIKKGDNLSTVAKKNGVKLKGFGRPSDVWKGIPWKQPQ